MDYITSCVHCEQEVVLSDIEIAEGLRERANKQATRIRDLEEALVPFVRLCILLEGDRDNPPDDRRMWGPGPGFSMADLRRARSAHEGKT